MINVLFRNIFLLLLSSCLLSCSNQPMENSYDENVRGMHKQLETGLRQNDQQAAEAAKAATLPNSVAQALMPTSLAAGDSKDGEQRFDISVSDVSAQTFFAGLAKDNTYSLVVSPKVTGNVTLDLKQVTLPQVLQTVRDLYGLHTGGLDK